MWWCVNVHVAIAQEYALFAVHWLCCHFSIHSLKPLNPLGHGDAGALGPQAGDNLDRWQVCRSHTHSHLQIDAACVLDCGGKPEHPEHTERPPSLDGTWTEDLLAVKQQCYNAPQLLFVKSNSTWYFLTHHEETVAPGSCIFMVKLAVVSLSRWYLS